ncbi:MAG: hypothetical protein V4487_00370 [Chlamydiota bacterium]
MNIPETEGWFTGPLLSATSVSVPAGDYDIEPYIFATAQTGIYNSNWEIIKEETIWKNLFQPTLEFGITSWMDFEFNPALFYNYTKGAAKWTVGDMPIGLNIQLYHRSPENSTEWDTSFLLYLKELVPLGKYQNLEMKKKGTDLGGEGSWQTLFGIAWGNLFYLGGAHFLNTIFSIQYTLPAPVHVKGLNSYGGGAGTRGKVYPAQNFLADVAFELSLSQNWVFAMDIVGTWSTRTRFKGKTLEQNTLGSAVQYSLAPAIEYNWGPGIGLIAGAWFTVAGRNSTQFTSGVIAFNYYH